MVMFLLLSAKSQSLLLPREERAAKFQAAIACSCVGVVGATHRDAFVATVVKAHMGSTCVNR